MNTINRIRIISSAYNNSVRFAVTKLMTGFPRHSTFTRDETQNNPEHFLITDRRGETGIRAYLLAQRLFEIEGITQAIFYPYEVDVSIAPAFKWEEGINEAVVAALKCGLFPNVSEVEVVDEVFSEQAKLKRTSSSSES
jgi:hypothetical protein